MIPTLPAEFFAIDELQRLAGSPQRARIIKWLHNNKVRHVVGIHGWPLVYRTNLLPHSETKAQNDDPTQFDFTAAHATSRTTTLRRAS